MNSDQLRRRILRYALSLVVISIGAGTVVLVYEGAGDRADRQAQLRLERYHLGALTQITRVEENLDEMRRRLQAESGPSRDAAGYLYAIDRDLVELDALHSKTVEAIDTTVLGHAQDSLEQLRRSYSAGSKDDTMLHLTAFELRLAQLSRLHTIAAQAELEELAVHRERRTRNLWLAIALVLAVTAAIVVRTLHLISANFRRQALAEEAVRMGQQRINQMQRIEALGQLVGGVAHDFNNLLTVILGNLQLLAGGRGDRTDAPELLEIRLAAERAASLTRQLLAFSRRQPIDPRVVDPGKLVNGMESMLARLLGKHLRFSVHTESEPTHVRVDPGQLEQVIMNLVINARDAMPVEGDLSVAVDRVTIDGGRPETGTVPAGTYCRITVGDTGIGMDDATRERIFEPFFTTKEKGHGTGLGLSTALGIVQLSDGHMLVDSTPGVGSRFTVLLPEVAAPVVADARAADPEPECRGSETLLLVEDEDQVNRLTTAALRRFGYHVLAAADGLEALSLCTDYPAQIDVIVSDIVMPGINGRELLDRVRELRPDAAVILMSGYTDDILEERGVSSLGCPLVHKPFEARELAALIRATLDATAACERRAD